MKRLFILFSLTFIVAVGAACSSPESEELADYHNTYIETVNPDADKIDGELAAFAMMESDEEALAYFEENVLPLVDNIDEFINSREPEADVVKELHDLRVKQLDPWFEGFDLLREGMEEVVDSGDEGEVMELFGKSDEKFLEANEKREEADERFLEMADEHNLELTEEEE